MVTTTHKTRARRDDNNIILTNVPHQPIKHVKQANSINHIPDISKKVKHNRYTQLNRLIAFPISCSQNTRKAQIHKALIINNNTSCTQYKNNQKHPEKPKNTIIRNIVDYQVLSLICPPYEQKHFHPFSTYFDTFGKYALF